MNDSSQLLVFAIYGVPAACLVLLYWLAHTRRSRQARHIWQASRESGLSEPASLHPSIDYARCIGCATCVKACPEKNVLGIIDNHARLITPAACIGHGACAAACPAGAIELVFGTATRGVDIPHVGKDFQTNIPGIYIAGELGGMGLIRNAIEQGRQALQAIADNGRARSAERLDLLIVGAGPAGLSAALAAREAGLRCTVLEQYSVGGTIAHYPRGKVVMTAPAKLPLVGEFQFHETSKESLMAFWLDVAERSGLDIRTRTRVETIEATEDGFDILAGERFRASNVLLAIGRRGTPRKLGIPGEDHSKVVYSLVDPDQYRGSNVVVVGGGDSALEAALSLAEEAGSRVLLSYRGNSFSRAKARNRQRLETAVESTLLEVELESQVREITPESVRIETRSGERVLSNDAVIICAGGVLPTAFLESLGIDVKTHYGTRA